MPWPPAQRVQLFLIPRLAFLLIRTLGCTLRFEELLAPGVTMAIADTSRVELGIEANNR